MKSFAFLLALVLGCGLATGSARADDDQGHEGEDMNVHNHTGHEVLVFLFQDANVHLSEEGGIQFADLHDGDSAVAHVPNCTYSILLVDHDDVWHAEFHDCHSTDMTFTADTGHAKKQH